MKIIIATPTLPPEINKTADYSWKVAETLANKKGHDVKVAAYAHLPENIPNVQMFWIDKQKPLLERIVNFKKLLQEKIKDADLVYVQRAGVAGVVVRQACRTTTPTTPYIVNFPNDEVWKRLNRDNNTDTYFNNGYRLKAFLKYPLLSAAQIYTLQKADKIIVPSQTHKNLLLNHFPIRKNKISVLPPPQTLIDLGITFSKKQKILTVFVNSQLTLSDKKLLQEIIDFTKTHDDIFLKIISADTANIQNLFAIHPQVSIINKLSISELSIHTKLPAVFIFMDKNFSDVQTLVNITNLKIKTVACNNPLLKEYLSGDFYPKNTTSLLPYIQTALENLNNFENQTNYSWNNHLEELDKIFTHVIKS